MKIDMSFLPDAKSGEWSIETFTVPKNDLSQAIAFAKYRRSVPEGTYKRLTRNGIVVMSNTPDEIRDFIHFTTIAKGSILINGQGIGCVLKALLEKPEISKITVIEKSQDVIELVKPFFNDQRLNIIHADAFDYKPNKKESFDFVWHDIWDYICADHLAEMAKLHRKYAKKTQWQDSWAKTECLRIR